MNESNIHDDDALSAELASLRQDVPPSRDLWPAIDAELDRGASRPWMWPVVLGGGALVAAGGLAMPGGRRRGECCRAAQSSVGAILTAGASPER